MNTSNEGSNRPFDADEFARFRADPKRQALVDRILASLDAPDARICFGCGAQGAGMFPVGWIIELVHELVGPMFAPMVVGERPICPGCQQASRGRS
jgi:hypothetical protein